MRTTLLHWLLAGLLMAATVAQAELPGDKMLIGPIEKLKVEETTLKYRARIDTGAARSALHALDIRIEEPAEDPDQNVGKWLVFTTLNHNDTAVEVRARIAEVVYLRNSMGRSVRYAVPLTLNWKGVPFTVNATLADRSKMTYKLLIGRDWLSGRYLVDVDFPEEE